jgi:conserved hypothetical protein
VLGTVIAGALLVWALRGVHPGEVLEHLRNAHLAPLLLAVVLATLTYPLRLVRWRLLLRDANGGPFPAAPLWHAIAIGFMANNILPFRAGELVRLLAAARLAGARFSAVLSSVAVERVFDGLTIVALLSLSLLASDLPPDVAVGGVSLRHAAQASGLLGAAALLAALLVVAFPVVAERVVRRLLPAGPLADRIVSLIEGLRQGLSALRSPALLAGTILWSIVIWLVNALAFYVAFKAFDIPVGLSRRAAAAGHPGVRHLGAAHAGLSRSVRGGHRGRPGVVSDPGRSGLLVCHRLSRHHVPSDRVARRLVARAHPGRAQ